MPEKKKGVKVPSFGEEIEKELKKQEKKSIKEPTFKINSKGKSYIERPKNHVKIIKKKEATINQEKDRIPTGIPGLDGLMGGGFLKGSANMVSGGAGSGKSIFAMQFLFNGIEKYDEPGIFISFEENSQKIVDEMNSFNWNLQKKIDSNKLEIVYYDPKQIQKFLEEGGGTIESAIERLKAKRLVIDSLSAFTLLFDNELTKRKAMLDLFETLRKLDVTTLVTAEQESDPEKHLSSVIEFEADSVILMYYLKKGDIRERSIEVFKMRATKHSAKIYPMQITNKGIVVYPEEAVF